MMYGLGVPVVIRTDETATHEAYPSGFRSRSLLERAFVPVARSFADAWAITLVPGKRKAEVLLVANERTRVALPPGCTGKVRIPCENGVEPDVWRRPDDLPARPDDGLRLAFLGRLLAWKVDMLIDVFVDVKKYAPSAESWIIGDGPERPRLQRQAEASCVSGAVTAAMDGRLPRNVRGCSRSATCSYPSVFDCGGAVVLEAIVVGTGGGGPGTGGGPGELSVASGAGVLVAPVDRRQSIAELAMAVRSLTPSKRRELGAAAQREIANHYTWPAKVRQMLRVFQSVCKCAKITASGYRFDRGRTCLL